LLKTEEVIAKKQSEDTNFVFVIWQCSGCALNVCRERGEVLDISGLVLCASMLWNCHVGCFWNTITHHCARGNYWNYLFSGLVAAFLLAINPTPGRILNLSLCLF